MRRLGLLLVGAALAALIGGPAAALPPTRAVNTNAITGITAGTGISVSGTTTKTVALATGGAGAATYCGGGQYVTSMTLDAYGRPTAVNCATPSAGAPAPMIVASLTGVATSQVYVTEAKAGSAGSTTAGNSLRVIVPSGAVIQMRVAVTTAITIGNTCNAYLKTATTPNGSLTTQQTLAFANADGASAVKLTSTYTTGSVMYVSVSALCDFSYGGLFYFTAERVA